MGCLGFRIIRDVGDFPHLAADLFWQAKEELLQGNRWPVDILGIRDDRLHPIFFGASLAIEALYAIFRIHMEPCDTVHTLRAGDHVEILSWGKETHRFCLKACFCSNPKAVGDFILTRPLRPGIRRLGCVSGQAFEPTACGKRGRRERVGVKVGVGRGVGTEVGCRVKVVVGQGVWVETTARVAVLHGVMDEVGTRSSVPWEPLPLLQKTDGFRRTSAHDHHK